MSYSEDDFLQLSGIQHFEFCRRQWALIHVEQQWADNLLTAEGILDHGRVHDERVHDIRKGRITKRGFRILSRHLGVSGTCDAVEFIPVKEGITLHGEKGQWSVMPIEYKHGSSKANDCDRLQVTLQAICLEEMFSTKVEEAAIFYFKNRRREIISITDDLRRKSEGIVAEMHSYMDKGYTPKVKSNKKCFNCSLNDICLPELMEANETVASYIDRFLKELNHEKDA